MVLIIKVIAPKNNASLTLLKHAERWLLI